MATPGAAGVAALVWSNFPSCTGTEIREALKATAEDQGTAGRDDYFGYGIVKAKNAYDYLLANGCAGGDTGGDDNAPTAGFTFNCTELSCTFTDTSSDDNGVTGYSWNFGDGNSSTAANPSHTFAADGTYTVSLTVTDTAGQTDTTSQSVTVQTADQGSLSLSANGYKIKGRHNVDLTWNGAASASVDIYRNGQLLTTTTNDGAYTDSTNNRGGAVYSYQVCEAGTSTCSSEVTVVF